MVPDFSLSLFSFYFGEYFPVFLHACSKFTELKIREFQFPYLCLTNEGIQQTIYIIWRNTSRHLFSFAFPFSTLLGPRCWISPAFTRPPPSIFAKKKLRFCSPPKKSAACAITLLTTLPFDLRPRREGRGGREFQAPRHLSLCPVSPRSMWGKLATLRHGQAVWISPSLPP